MSSKKSTRGQVPAVVDILGFRMATGEYQEGEVLPVEQDMVSSTDDDHALRR